MATFVQAQNVSFTASDWAKAQNLEADDQVTTYTQDGVTVTFTAGEGEQPTWSGHYINAVAGNTMTVSAPEGKVLRSAVFTTTVSTVARYLASSTWDSGKVSNSGTEVTWKGNAQSLTVTFSGTRPVRMTDFSVTFGEPDAPEDIAHYTDTTTVTVADWLAAEYLESDDRVDATSYQKEGKTLAADKATGSNQLRSYGSYLSFYQDNTLTITSPYQIRKVVFTLTNEDDASYFLEGKDDSPAATCSSGSFKEDEDNSKNVIWLGASSSFTITFGYRTRISSIMIISDKTKTNATVTFVGLPPATIHT